jgi:hypothetical protein
MDLNTEVASAMDVSGLLWITGFGVNNRNLIFSGTPPSSFLFLHMNVAVFPRERWDLDDMMNLQSLATVGACSSVG